MLINTKAAYDIVTMLNEEEVDLFNLISVLETINQMKDKVNKAWFYKYLQAKSSNISTKVQDFIHKKQLALISDVHMDILMQIKNLELLELLDEYGILKNLILFMNKSQIENIIDFLNYLKNHKSDMVKYQENLHYLLENFRYFNLLPSENLDIEGDCFVTGSEGVGIISDGHFEFDFCPENEDAYCYNLSQAKMIIYYKLSKNQIIDKEVTVNDLAFDTSCVPKTANEFLNKALHPNVPYIKHRDIRCQILYLNKKLSLLENTKKLFAKQKEFLKTQNATFGEYADLEEHQKAINELMSLTYEKYYKDTLENTGLDEDQLNYALVLNSNNLGKQA